MRVPVITGTLSFFGFASKRLESCRAWLLLEVRTVIGTFATVQLDMFKFILLLSTLSLVTVSVGFAQDFSAELEDPADTLAAIPANVISVNPGGLMANVVDVRYFRSISA